MLIRKEFAFDAAHNLVHYRGKCEALHGHRYRLAVEVEGEPDADGMVMDFGDVADVVRRRVVSRLDHAYINEIIASPTAENIAAWTWREVEPELPGLSRVEVWETPESCAILRRGDRR
ncbi:MAG: 6-carboxytetrahydropterin synthase QueD [Synergistaceae bacterium]|jgi:6-pyruvoyltetrahydropterin/6-carboxytetrahydropterin synthase|nr:6-carboxytetrahydropterin synthase QueD [Synergistaceae bacterium]